MFYTTLFGWQSENLPAGELGTVTVLRHGGCEVAILYRQTPEARVAQAAPHWTSFVRVWDAEASALRAQALGAVLLRAPVDLSDAGRVAALRDPSGAILSLWQCPELLDDVAAPCRYELVATDIDRARRFYGALFSWEYERDDSSGSTTVTSAGTPIGSMRDPGRAESATVNCWTPYFALEDAQSTQRIAEHSDGRILSAPRDTPNGRTALLADPQGVTFGVLEQSRRFSATAGRATGRGGLAATAGTAHRRREDCSSRS